MSVLGIKWISFICLPAALFASEGFNQQNALYVSLGSHCEVAVALRKSGLRYSAYPFDWLITVDQDGIIALLDGDFRDFLNKEMIFPSPVYPDVTENKAYKIEYRHEGYILEQDYLWEMMREKYERRIDRFRQIGSSDDKVIFIRVAYDIPYCGLTYWLQEDEPTINSQGAKKLKQALDRYFPNLDFTLIILNYEEDLPYPIEEIEGVIEFKIRKTHRESDFKAILDTLRNFSPFFRSGICH